MTKIKNFFFSEKHTMRNSLLIFSIMQFVIALVSLYSKTNPNKNFIIFSIIILASTICLYWILQTINYNHDLEPKHVKLTKNIKTIIAIVAFSLIGEILINYYLPQLLNVSLTQNSNLNEQSLNQMKATPIGMLTENIYAICIAPVIEEFLFRYALIKPKSLEPKLKLSRKYRTIISMFVFAFMHVMIQTFMINSSKEFKLTLITFCAYFIISSLLSINYYKKGNIKQNMLAHIAYNATVTIIQVI